MKTYKLADLEWCGGRMAHLRPKGQDRTICGADPIYFPDALLAPGGRLHRPTLTDEQAAQEHKCKTCLKRVEPTY